MYNDEYFMLLALQQAENAFDEGEIPVGALIVCQDQIIAKGYKPIILWECDLINNQIQAKKKLSHLIDKIKTSLH